MPTDLLRRPIWTSLLTVRREFVHGGGDPAAYALRFDPDVSPFAAAQDDAPESLAALGALVPPNGKIVLLQADPIRIPDGIRTTLRAEGVQMMFEGPAPPPPERAFVTLGDADAAEMVDLAARTKPGPFLAKTHRFGGFLGVRVDGRLAAMAGERLRQPGFTEVSGVCVDLAFRGRGLAAALSLAVVARILSRGDAPYLHAYADNHAAIGLYERLGFRVRRKIDIAALVRA